MARQRNKPWDGPTWDFENVCAGCGEKAAAKVAQKPGRRQPTFALVPGWFEDVDPAFPDHPTKRLRFCPGCKDAPLAKAEARIAEKQARQAARRAARLTERAEKAEAREAERKAKEGKRAGR